jgi:Invasin, domain 3
LTTMRIAPRRLRLFGASLALAATAVLGGAAVVSAYTPPGSVLSVTQSCPTASPGASCTLQFQLKDANGNPVCNATVTFTTSGVAGSTVTPASAQTGSSPCSGNVAALFTAGSGCGTATITASSPPASAQTTINVPCAAATLPNTSTLPPSTPMWLPGLVALALALVAACGLTLRRMRVTS